MLDFIKRVLRMDDTNQAQESGPIVDTSAAEGNQATVTVAETTEQETTSEVKPETEEVKPVVEVPAVEETKAAYTINDCICGVNDQSAGEWHAKDCPGFTGEYPENEHAEVTEAEAETMHAPEQVQEEKPATE